MSRLAILTALLAGLFGFVVTILLIMKLPFARSHPLGTAAVVCGVLSVSLALLRPAGSWRWGVLVAAAFVVYFGFVFVSFLANGRFLITPLFQALLPITVSTTGAYLSARLMVARRSHLNG